MTKINLSNNYYDNLLHRDKLSHFCCFTLTLFCNFGKVIVSLRLMLPIYEIYISYLHEYLLRISGHRNLINGEIVKGKRCLENNLGSSIRKDDSHNFSNITVKSQPKHTKYLKKKKKAFIFLEVFVCFLLITECVFISYFLDFYEICIQNSTKRITEMIKALSLLSKQNINNSAQSFLTGLQCWLHK